MMGWHTMVIVFLVITTHWPHILIHTHTHTHTHKYMHIADLYGSPKKEVARPPSPPGTAIDRDRWGGGRRGREWEEASPILLLAFKHTIYYWHWIKPITNAKLNLLLTFAHTCMHSWRMRITHVSSSSYDTHACMLNAFASVYTHMQVV